MKPFEDLPKKHQAHFENLVRIYSTKNLRPPTILKGLSGTGKSWLLSSVFQEISNRASETQILPVRLPGQLSAVGLVKKLGVEIEKATSLFMNKQSAERASSIKCRFVIFIENIDRLYNLSNLEGDFSRPRRLGPGSTQHAQVQYASELRRYLIENSNKVTVLASSGKHTSFMEDPDQPFYEFFNVINIETLDETECAIYIQSKLKRMKVATENFKPLLEYFRKINPLWLLHLTDGKISHLNSVIDANLQICSTSSSTLVELINEFLSAYFYRIAGSSNIVLENLSYNEKMLMDRIVEAPNDFRTNDVAVNLLNTSQYLKSLLNKRIVTLAGKGKTATYRLNSISVKAWLRYHRKIDVPLVIDVNRPLIG